MNIAHESVEAFVTRPIPPGHLAGEGTHWVDQVESTTPREVQDFHQYTRGARSKAPWCIKVSGLEGRVVQTRSWRLFQGAERLASKVDIALYALVGETLHVVANASDRCILGVTPPRAAAAERVVETRQRPPAFEACAGVPRGEAFASRREGEEEEVLLRDAFASLFARCGETSTLVKGASSAKVADDASKSTNLSETSGRMSRSLSCSTPLGIIVSFWPQPR